MIKSCIKKKIKIVYHVIQQDIVFNLILTVFVIWYNIKQKAQCNLVSFDRFISYDVILISYGIISYDTISCHIMIWLYHIIFYDIMQFCMIWYNIIHDTMQCYTYKMILCIIWYDTILILIHDDTILINSILYHIYDALNNSLNFHLPQHPDKQDQVLYLRPSLYYIYTLIVISS